MTARWHESDRGQPPALGAAASHGIRGGGGSSLDLGHAAADAHAVHLAGVIPCSIVDLVMASFDPALFTRAK